MRKRLLAITTMALAGGFLLGPRASEAATYTVNVYTSTSAVEPAKLQKDFIASTTNQYLSTLKAGFFNAYTLTIRAKNPAYTPPVVSTTIVTLDRLVDKMILASTWTYIYGAANGMDYQRAVDMNRISNYLINCSSGPYFGVHSTASWNWGTCTTALNVVLQDIYSLKFSSPTVIPTMPIIITGPLASLSNVVLRSKTTPDCYQLRVNPNGSLFTVHVTCPQP